MEVWQEEHILQNFPSLIKLTNCTTNLLASLRAKRILGAADGQAIEAYRCQLEQAYRLYDIGRTRRNAYGSLMQCLQDDSQSGALGILYKGLILHQPVKFQKSELVVNKFPLEIRPHNLEELILPSIDEPFLRDWISKSTEKNNPPELVKCTIPPTPKYYIPRRISCTRRLSPEVLHHTHHPSDIFVVKGVGRSQLTSLVNNQEIKYSSTQTKGVTGQYILLEYEGDYDRICEVVAKFTPVHLLSWFEGHLSWIKSHGSIARIQKHLIPHQQEEFMEEDVFVAEVMTAATSSSPAAICIADTPGMGKSVILARIGEKLLRSTPPHSVVQFIVFREFVRELEGGGGKINDLESLCHLIAQSCSDYQVGREVVLKSLKSQNIPSYILLDGYDEVLPTQVSLANWVLAQLKTLPKLSLVVTSRPHRRRELEEALGALGYNMSPFGKGDQVEFLTSYWVEEGGADDEKKGRLKEFAGMCLTNLQTSLSQYERDITGIPLQCMLLAKVHSHHAVQVSKKNTNSQEEEEEASPTKFMEELPRNISSIFDMYQILMEDGFQKLTAGASTSVLFSSEDFSFWKRLAVHLHLLPTPKTLKESVLDAHMYYALELLFPGVVAQFRDLLLSTSTSPPPPRHPSILSAQLYVPGLLEPTTIMLQQDNHHHLNHPRFVHRTFAEYLVAWFIVKFMKKLLLGNNNKSTGGGNFRKLLLQHVLPTSARVEPIFWMVAETIPASSFDNQMICYFLNSLLLKSRSSSSYATEEFPPIFQMSPVQNPSELPIVRVREAFTASVVHNFPAIATLLASTFPNCFSDLERDDGGVPWWSTLWLLGAKYSGVETLKVLLKSTSCYCSSSSTSHHHCLPPPAQLQYPTCSILDSRVPITPPHVAVDRGEYDVTVFLFTTGGFSEAELQQQTLKPGFKVAPNIFHICAYASSLQATGIVSKKCQIIQFLLDGTDWGRSLLHGKMADGATPLLLPGIHLDLVKCLIDAGADIHACTESEDTILHKFLKKDTAVGGSPVTPEEFHVLVETLSSVGFTFFGRANADGRTPLHEALETVEVNPSTLDYLLNLKNAEGQKMVEMNARDNMGASILVSAVRGGRSRQVVRHLVEAGGADVSVTNGGGEGLLAVASHVGNLDAVDYLLEAGPSLLGGGEIRWKQFLNQVDSRGNSVLHHAVVSYTPQHSEIQSKLIQTGLLLLEAGGRRNDEGCTPFLQGLRVGRGLSLATIRLLEKHGAYRLDPDEMGLGLLHLLTSLVGWEWDEGRIAAAEYLIQRGAKVGWSNKEGGRGGGGDPWRDVAPTIQKIIEVTEVSEVLVGKLVTMGILKENELNILKATPPSSKSSVMYSMLQSSSAPTNSYEVLMISLIGSHQPQPFTMLRQPLLHGKAGFIRFVTPPPALAQFMESGKGEEEEEGDQRILFLFSSDPDTTLTRIQNTVNSSIRPQVLKDCWDRPELEFLHGRSTTMMKMTFAVGPPDLDLHGGILIERLLAMMRNKNKFDKIVVIVADYSSSSSLSEQSLEGFKAIIDKSPGSCWSTDLITEDDLAPSFLKIARTICSKMRKQQPAKEDLFQRCVHALSKLSNEELHLLAGTKRRIKNQCGGGNWRKNRSTSSDFKLFPRNIISETAFNHVLGGDLCLFTGIRLEQLQAWSKWSSVAVVKSGQRLIADYILLENNGDNEPIDDHYFEWIISQPGVTNVHLLEYANQEFHLVRTHGHMFNLAKHLRADYSQAVRLDDKFFCHHEDDGTFIIPSVVKVIHVPDGSHAKAFVDAMTRAADASASIIFLKIEDIGSILSKFKLVRGDDEELVKGAYHQILIELFLTSQEDVIPGTGEEEEKPSILHFVVLLQRHATNQEELEALAALADLIRGETVDLAVWVVVSSSTSYGSPKWEFEGILGPCGFELRPLSVEEQVQLICDLWWCKEDLELTPIIRQEDYARLEKFARNCLDNYETRVLSKLPVWCDEIHQGKWKEWWWNPAVPPQRVQFYCFLLGKCFQAEASSIMCAIQSWPEDFGVDAFIALCNRVVRLSISGGTSDEASFQKGVTRLAKLALTLHFPVWAELITATAEFMELAQLVSSGIIVEDVEGTFVFQFDEFAWYFIALILVDPQFSECLKNEQQLDDDARLANFTQLIFSREFYNTRSELVTFKYDALMYFINGLLPLHGAAHFSRLLGRGRRRAEFGELCRACVAGVGLVNILKLTTETGSQVVAGGGGGGRASMCAASLVWESVLFGNLAMVEHICDLYVGGGNPTESLQDIRFPFQDWRGGKWSLAELAAFRGDYSVLDYLVNQAGFKSVLIKDKKNYSRVLGQVVRSSLLDSAAVVVQKKNMLQLLLSSIESTLLDAMDGTEDSLLTLPNCHPDLLAFLISSGAADVMTSVNKQGLTMLHLASSYLTPNQFHRLVSHVVVDCGKAGALGAKDREGNTVLYTAICNMELLPETLDIFGRDDAKLNFQSSTSCFRSVLWGAVTSNRSATLISKLIQLGQNWRERDYCNWSLLHNAAATGNVSAIKLLISKGIDVNYSNHDNQTPLHSALSGPPKSNLLAVVRVLGELGAELKMGSSSSSTSTPLYNALYYNESPGVLAAVQYLLGSHQGRIKPSANANLPSRRHHPVNPWAPRKISAEEYHDFVQFLEDHSFTYLLKGWRQNSGDYDTGLYLAVSRRELMEETLKIFLKYCDINSKGSDGDDSVLLKAIENNWSEDFIKMPVRYGADPKVRDGRKRNVLHVAAQFRNFPALKLFIGGGVDVNEKDDRGYTPLHLAAQAVNGRIVPEICQLLVEHGADPSGTFWKG